VRRGGLIDFRRAAFRPLREIFRPCRAVFFPGGRRSVGRFHRCGNDLFADPPAGRINSYRVRQEGGKSCVYATFDNLGSWAILISLDPVALLNGNNSHSHAFSPWSNASRASAIRWPVRKIPSTLFRLRDLVQRISGLMIVEIREMDKRAAEGVHRPCPAVKRVGEVDHLAVRDWLFGIGLAPTPPRNRVFDQSVPVRLIVLCQEEHDAHQGVEFLAEDRDHLPRQGAQSEHGLPVFSRPCAYLTTERLDLVHALHRSNDRVQRRRNAVRCNDLLGKIDSHTLFIPFHINTDYIPFKRFIIS